MTPNLFMGIDPNKTIVIVLNEKGFTLAKYLNKDFGCSIFAPAALKCDTPLITYDSIKDAFSFAFINYKYIVAIMATGIVVRTISKLTRSKFVDPAIVVVDEGAHYAISTLSGHEGGANKLACLIASFLGCEPVISTASDVLKDYIIGLGFRKNVTQEDLHFAVEKACNYVNINFQRIKYITTIKAKMNCRALEDYIVKNNFLFRFIDEKLLTMPHFNFNSFATPVKYLNIPAVAEPSAILSAKRPKLIFPRKIINGVAVAVVKDSIYD